MSGSRDEAVRRFLHADYARVVRVVSVVCTSRAEAEDAVQEALVSTWARRDDPTNYAAWVTAVALNKARGATRRLRAESRASSRLPSPASDSLDGLDSAADLGSALARLSVRQRQVTVLRYWHDLDVAGIARVLSISEGTVKTQLSRARAALATSLQTPLEASDAHR